MMNQWAATEKNLGLKSIDLYYLHAPDHATPIEQTLEAVDKLHKAGHFRRFGLSNFSAWQVVEIYYICKAKGYILPTVYQGMYNFMTRDCERELFPALKRLNIAFYAYNPLAGGLLTGRYKFEDLESQPIGRFFGNEWAQRYRDRYWKKENFTALEALQKTVKEEYGDKTTMAQVAIRWMLHHSQMSGTRNDAVIVGASNLPYLKENLGAWDKAQGPLSEKVVKHMDAVWDATKHFCPPYFR